MSRTKKDTYKINAKKVQGNSKSKNAMSTTYKQETSRQNMRGFLISRLEPMPIVLLTAVASFKLQQPMLFPRNLTYCKLLHY